MAAWRISGERRRELQQRANVGTDKNSIKTISVLFARCVGRRWWNASSARASYRALRHRRIRRANMMGSWHRSAVDDKVVKAYRDVMLVNGCGVGHLMRYFCARCYLCRFRTHHTCLFAYTSACIGVRLCTCLPRARYLSLILTRHAPALYATGHGTPSFAAHQANNIGADNGGSSSRKAGSIFYHHFGTFLRTPAAFAALVTPRLPSAVAYESSAAA